MDEKRAGAVRHSRTSHTSDYQRRATLENIFDMKGAYVAHIPDTACSPHSGLGMRWAQTFSANTLQT